ncbi:hypothetical protein Tco_0698621 [Tanacetum coccineum]
MPPENEILPAEEQPLPAADSPTADSPGYVPESDPEADLEEDDDEDPEEDPADYPADEGDDGDDEDELSDDDKDEEVDIEADDEEEEVYLAPADSTAVALLTIDQAPSAEETEPVETDESTATLLPHPAYRVTARISIPAPIPTPVWYDAEIPSPPLPPILSPLPVSPPLPRISSPPLPVSSPVPVLSPSPPASPIRPLGYRAAMIRLRAEAASTSHSLPLPPPIILSHTRPDAPSSGTPPLHLLSTDCRADRPEVTLPSRKTLGIALGPGYEVGESSSTAAVRPARGLRADYGFVATMDREIRQDTNEIYTRLDDEQTERQLLAGQLNMLFKDRRVHARTARLMEEEARMSREAWGRSMDASALARAEVMSLRTTVLAQQSEIKELQSADRRRKMVITEMLAADHKRQAMIDQGVTAALAARDANRRTKGVAGLSQWFKRMESVFHISNCTVENQVKFATCTLNSVALTRWNTHVKTVGHDAAYGMPWKTLMKMMTDKYCPRNEIKKLEMKIWDLKVKESDKIEKYVDGLPNMIYRSVVASKPKKMHDAVEITTELMDKKIRTLAERQTESKRNFEDTSRNTQNQQQQNKRQNTGRAYTARTGDKNPYGGSKPLCAK